ncbi:hypothetical protein A6V29_04990 [Blastococcus sp. CCUG 61487]|nr:hypothetical protein A6V29_04990 [Blastococcus sp. CCUG 61487]
MDRHCASCRKPLSSTSPRARFCNSTCRSRAHRAGGLAAVESSAQPVDLATRRAASAPAPAGIVAAVIAKLTEADRLDTWEGQAALDLAQQMADAPAATLSARAAANKELREAMALALKGVGAPTSSVQEIRDELARRRRERAQGAV